MSLILNVDTASALAGVSLTLNGDVLQERANGQMTDHASWIHVAIKEMMQEGGYQLADLNAVSVVAGPGSYTGLRVGMSTAKGLCFALQIPLISLNTLRLMAHATNKDVSSSQLLCPMLDARRLEVFTALYNNKLEELIKPCALVLDENAFADWLNKHEIIFFGNGSSKWKEMVQHSNAVFRDIHYTSQDIATVANNEFLQQHFSDLAYSEPIYLKDFYSPQKLTG